eukprot:scaffold20853_cov57-Phaeocystis_antarctica.AAC.3
MAAALRARELGTAAAAAAAAAATAAACLADASRCGVGQELVRLLTASRNARRELYLTQGIDDARLHLVEGRGVPALASRHVAVDHEHVSDPMDREGHAARAVRQGEEPLHVLRRRDEVHVGLASHRGERRARKLWAQRAVQDHRASPVRASCAAAGSGRSQAASVGMAGWAQPSECPVGLTSSQLGWSAATAGGRCTAAVAPTTAAGATAADRFHAASGARRRGRRWSWRGTRRPFSRGTRERGLELCLQDQVPAEQRSCFSPTAPRTGASEHLRTNVQARFVHRRSGADDENQRLPAVWAYRVMETTKRTRRSASEYSAASSFSKWAFCSACRRWSHPRLR